MNDKLQFYQSYLNIDIWFNQNTKTGITKYMFFYQGKTYERESHGEIIALAKFLQGNTKGRQRGE